MNNLIWLLKQENQSLDALFSRIREVVSDMLEDAGLEHLIKIPECFDDIVINRDTSRQIYLITKEAVNNAIKHSNATKIIVEAVIQNNLLTLKISDNGRGFVNANEISTGNGLLNMKSRAKQISGSLIITSELNCGSTVSLLLNLDEIKG
jgi:signal transduction histidine kinase